MSGPAVVAECAPTARAAASAGFDSDAEAFDALATLALPRICDGCTEDTLRLWVSGCATGEEAYRLAMIASEQVALLAKPPRVQIFATDTDDASLQIARQGRYPELIEKQLSPERLQRFFTRDRSGYRVRDELRERCTFSSHDLMRNPPFSRLDLICCRTLLTGFGHPYRQRALSLFHYALKPEGYLLLGADDKANGELLGAAESAHGELFRAMDDKHRLYRRLGGPLPSAARSASIEVDHLSRDALVMTAPKSPLLNPDPGRTFERIVLQSFAPPSVLVTETGDAVHFSGPVARYLEYGAGDPRANLLDMVPATLRATLRTALAEACASQALVIEDEIAFERKGVVHHVRLIVRPMPELAHGDALFAVVFQDLLNARARISETVALATHDSLTQQLEQELESTKQRLEATIGDLVGTNEELSCSIEELQSINEELQAAQEDTEHARAQVAIANGCLEALNVELEGKLKELNSTNGDLSNLLQSSQIAAVFLDRSLHVRRFTPAATRVLGLLDEDIGKPIAELSTRLGLAGLCADVEGVLRTMLPKARQLELSTLDAWYLLRVLPYRTLDHRIEGVVITLVEIDELKRTEIALRESEERYRSLTAVLVAADERKDEFLAMLAHELRNPLAPIRNALALLGTKSGDPGTVERVRVIVDRQTQALVRMVDDLLDVARLVRGRIELHREPVAMADIVERALETVQPLAKKRAQTLRAVVPQTPIMVNGDVVRLSQVLSNLLQNAVKFTPSGGRVDLSVTQEAQVVSVHVRDTGVGIPKEMLGRIFELFEQTSRSLDRVDGGLGIGLTLARRLAEMHGGTVTAHSEGPSCGSEFTLSLPALAPQSFRPTRASAPPGPNSPLNILVVDDNVDAAEMLSEVLRLDGHEVAMAHDGAEALELAERRAPQVLFLDIGLPKLDGFEVVKALRARQQGQVRPFIVAVTGYGQASDRERCELAGFDRHLTKPIGLEAIQDVLAQARAV